MRLIDDVRHAIRFVAKCSGPNLGRHWFAFPRWLSRLSQHNDLRRRECSFVQAFT
jgi:hypothetical protein